jgi:hypothetical protein
VSEQATDQVEVAAAADLRDFAAECARDAQMYLDTITEVASGSAPEAAIPMTLLAISQVLSMGTRLGAMQDIVPPDQYETDPGPDTELGPLRDGIANLFEGLDDYADLVDPVTSPEVTTGRLSDDLTEIASGLMHGLSHFREGRAVEALWWWQFSYLSSWGERAAMSLRVLHSILAHNRLDADEDLVSEAEFDALHP